MKIGNVEIENNIVLGPMAGITDMPFRALCKEQGASLTYTEMVSAKGLFYKNKNSYPLMEIAANEGPVAVQLFGSEPELMAEEARKLEERAFAIYDINMGCPVPKVVNNHEGSALMLDLPCAESIIKAMVKAVSKPVTVKFRKGFDDNHINAVEFAKMAEGAGAAAIAVHGRTRSQYYSGIADWDIIRQVKEAVSIPVIGSGDVYDAFAAKKMLDETGCDGVMVARGARGNPWIFKQINEYLADGTLPVKPEIPEVKEMIMRHAALLIDFTGEEAAIRLMRKHVGYYCMGYHDATHLRREINKCETLEQFTCVLTKWGA